MNNAIRELAPDELALVAGGGRHKAIITSDPVKGSGNATTANSLVQAMAAAETAIIQNIGH